MVGQKHGSIKLGCRNATCCYLMPKINAVMSARLKRILNALIVKLMENRWTEVFVNST
jgi:hypothetical protein